MLYMPAWWADTCLGHKARPAQLPDRSLASPQPHPQPQTSWRAIRQPLLLRQSRADARTLNNLGPAAELCIISDLLDTLQDANQPQIKSSSKLMSNHILSVQLHSVTRELPEREGGFVPQIRWEGSRRSCAPLPRALHSSSPSSWP